MLELNIRRIFELRGVDDIYGFMKECGFNRSTTYNIINGRVKLIRTETVELLCLKLNCTPNDLFELKYDPDNALDDNHQLNRLQHTEQDKLIKRLLSEIPVDKLIKMVEALN